MSEHIISYCRKHEEYYEEGTGCLCCDKEQARHKNHASTGSIRLSSVKVVGRVGYLNSDPAMPFMLPYGAWRVNELADQIVRACLEYDIAATWDNAHYLAVKLARDIIKDTIKGGFNIDY